MRCPACGATNPDAAAWCGQCYRTFGTPPAAAPAPAAEGPPPNGAGSPRPGAGSPRPGAGSLRPGAGRPPDDAGRPGPGAGSPRQPAPSPADDVATGDPATGFRRSGEDIEWACVTCGRYNPLHASRCAVCGTPMAARYQTAPDTPPVNWGAALALSSVLPGGGHLLAGAGASGTARALLYVLWLLGGVAVATQGGPAVLVAAPLLLGAAAVWGATLLDVRNLERGRPELLAGRTLLWMVIAVTALFMVAGAVVLVGSAGPAGGDLG